MTQGETVSQPPTSADTGSNASREAYYDGIRGIAIALVLLFHWLSSYVPWFQGGYVGVDIFFVLSGFIITTILWRRRPGATLIEEHRSFLGNRVRRLYPALLGLLVGGTLLNWAFGETAASMGETVRSAVLAALEAPSMVEALQLDAVAPFGQTWSLSVEWMFYLAWPLVLLAARRAGVRPHRLAAVAAVVALVLYGLSLLTSPAWFYFGITSRSTQILLGSALSLRALSDRPLPRVPGRVLTAAVVASLAFVAGWAVFGPRFLAAEYRYVAFPLVTVASLALVSVPVLAPGSWSYRLLSWRPLAAVGLVSYSLYLWHTLPLDLLDKDRIHLPLMVLALLGMGMAAALTATSYVLLERPFTRPRAAALQFRTAQASVSE